MPMKAKMLAPLALLSALVLVAPAIANAQSTPKSVAEAAQRLKKPLPLMLSLDALGMWRGTGANEKLDKIVRVEFKAHGTTYTPAASGEWQKHAVESMTFGVNYELPASRVDTVVVQNGAKQRSIEVVREHFAWNETTPGVGATPAPGAAEDRLNEIRVLPHAFMRAVALADAKDVKVSKAGGKTIVALTTPAGIGRATIGAGNFPERIEIPVTNSVLGKTTMVGVYSGYKNWDGYEVFFPAHIVVTLGGKPFADLTVTEHAVGPYLVWPVPAIVSQQATK